jgi:hypothetical protein
MKPYLHHSIGARTSVRSTFLVRSRCGLKPLLLSAALALVTQAGLAQTWSTVDDFQYSLGTNSYATGLATDATGTIIYAAGDGQDGSGIWHALAFKSTDGGTTWSLMDNYVDPTSPAGYGVGYDAGIAADPFGNLYASGYDYLTTGGATWFTRRSPDGGMTWSTVDTLPPNGTISYVPRALAADNAGNLYVVGVSNNTKSGWIVRKGNAGTTWATVDQIPVPQNLNGSCAANGALCHPTAGVFVVGQTTIPAKNRTGKLNIWTVRRSRDGGVSWTTVDTLVTDAFHESHAAGVGSDNQGNIYVVGQTQSGSGNMSWSWLVRKSTDGGNSWAQVDNYLPPKGYSSGANAVGCDSYGNVFVAGYNGTTGWVARESVGGTGTWNNTDTASGSPSAIVGNAFGNVFVAGSAYGAAGVQHWIIRKR